VAGLLYGQDINRFHHEVVEREKVGTFMVEMFQQCYYRYTYGIGPDRPCWGTMT